MSTNIAIIVATLLVIAATIIPTYLINNRQKTTESDWAIADRSLPLYVVVGTQFASAMGGGILVAHVGNAYNLGVGHFLYGILGCVPFLIIMVIAKWLRHNNYTTIPEILRTFTNNNKAVTVVAALMTLIVPFGWVTSQITAFGNIYASLTGIDYNILCIAFAVLGLLFVMPSGLKTVAWTDFIFSCFMCVICVICIIYVTGLGGGIGSIVSSLNAQDSDLLSLSGSLVAQQQKYADIGMGTGAIVIGLAAIVIGDVLMGRAVSFWAKLISAVVGSIVYFVIRALVLRIGLDANDMKLFSAIFVALALCIPVAMSKWRLHKAYSEDGGKL